MNDSLIINNYMKFIYSIILSVIVFSCNNRTQEVKDEEEGKTSDIELQYAKGFSIKKNEVSKFVNIKNPWQGAENVEYKYQLIHKSDSLVKTLSSFQVIRTPIERVICLSTTHIGFLDVLNETESIVAVSGAKYVNNLKLRDKIETNKLQDVGYDNSLNYELIASLKPDLVISFGISGQVAGYNQKLNDLGIQTMIIAEYLEMHPLGKLEWLKLIAALFEKEELAQRYFDKKVKSYNSLTSITKNVENKPDVLLGLPWKGTWYVPGGNSFLAKMIEDAGGNYIWKDNDARESLPLGIESIFAKASEADVWINTGTINHREKILDIDNRFKDFAPYNQGKIYNNNLQLNQNGGNNYWEKGLIEPDVILKDLIKIFQPKLLPNHKLVYYKNID